MTLLFHMRLAGVFLVLLGLAHAFFGRFLDWEIELARLSTVNRQIFQLHCFYIAMLLVSSGAAWLLLPEGLLVPQPLTRAISGLLALLWTIRLGAQWCFFERSIWMFDRVRRIAHYLLTAWWLYLSVISWVAFRCTFR